MRQLLRCGARAFEPEEIADARRGGNQQNEFRSIRNSAKTGHSLIACSHIALFPTGRIEQAEICFTFLCIDREDVATIGAPHRRKAAAAARGGIVSAHARANVIVKIACQISGPSIWRQIHDPEVRFRERLDWLIQGSIKSDLFTVRAYRKSARGHLERSELHRLTAGGDY